MAGKRNNRGGRPKKKPPDKGTNDIQKSRIIGRPSKYEEVFADVAAKMTANGATTLELAKEFKVDHGTINHWMTKFPSFGKAVRDARPAADARVIRALFERACGYSYDAMKMFFDGKKVIEHPYTEHCPPDTTACIFWLKNRLPKDWRDRRDDFEGNGAEIIIRDATALGKMLRREEDEKK